VRYLVDNSKVSDHHAIIPTDEPVNLIKLSPEERNIYDLVIRRFLAVLSPAFEYEETKLTVVIGKDRFYAKGKIVKTPGWKLAYGKDMAGRDITDQDADSQDDGDADADVIEQTLPVVRQGDRYDLKSCAVETGKTKPPARYNEATLLTAMENPSDRQQLSDELRAILKTTSGLGTPATRADIIEKLFATFYIERHGKEIVPTSKGIQLMSIVPTDLRSAELTARWEQELALISKGKSKSGIFLTEMRDYTKRLVSAVIASNATYVHDNITREICPECGKFLLEVNGKRGVMRICPDRECGYRRDISVQTNARCPNCHKKLELRGEGDKRAFYCICGYRERLSDFEKRRVGAGASKREVANFLQSQNRKDSRGGGGDSGGGGGGDSALAAQLAKWKEQNK
jgi:DNA topoisomerase-3